MKDGKKLRVAIVGYGRSGRGIHGKYLLTDTERFEIVAVVENMDERRKLAAREYSCDTYADYTDLYGRKDIDFVVNTTFSQNHGPTTLDLLQHGFNVLVEKPAASSPEQMQDMIDAARQNNVMLAVFQQKRFQPAFEKICQILDSGVLGRPVQISMAVSNHARRWDWQCCQKFNGGALLNTGPHPLDQALHILDYPGMPEVVCHMDLTNTFGDAEDYVKLILKAPDRPVIDLEVSYCDAYPEYNYKIQGTRGGLKGTFKKLDWRWYDDTKAPDRKVILQPMTDEEGLPDYCKEDLEWNRDSWEISEDNKTRRLYDTVYDNLVKGTPLVVTPEQVKQQLEVIFECHAQNPMPTIEDCEDCGD